jgi:hypothetical protein
VRFCWGEEKRRVTSLFLHLLLHFTALLHDCIAAQQSQTYESAMDGGLRSPRDSPMFYVLTIENKTLPRPPPPLPPPIWQGDAHAIFSNTDVSSGFHDTGMDSYSGVSVSTFVCVCVCARALDSLLSPPPRPAPNTHQHAHTPHTTHTHTHTRARIAAANRAAGDARWGGARAGW